MEIDRQDDLEVSTVAASGTVGSAISTQCKSFGYVKMPEGLEGTTLNWQVDLDGAGTYTVAVTSAGAPLDNATVAPNITIQLPAEIMGLHVKPVVAAQSAEREFKFLLFG